MIEICRLGTEQEIDLTVSEQERRPELYIVDIGGAMKPLSCASWVADIEPYEFSVGRTARGSGARRYSKETWLETDLCVIPWKFVDKQFHFSFCSQTVEDVRDPVALVSEISRISRGGFISTVNWKHELQSFEGDWVGYSHHRWLVNVHNGVLEFVHKPIYLRPRSYNEIVFNPLLHIWWFDDVLAREVFYNGRPDQDEFVNFLTGRWGVD